MQLTAILVRQRNDLHAIVVAIGHVALPALVAAGAVNGVYGGNVLPGAVAVNALPAPCIGDGCLTGFVEVQADLVAAVCVLGGNGAVLVIVGPGGDTDGAVVCDATADADAGEVVGVVFVFVVIDLESLIGVLNPDKILIAVVVIVRDMVSGVGDRLKLPVAVVFEMQAALLGVGQFDQAITVVIAEFEDLALCVSDVLQFAVRGKVEGGAVAPTPLIAKRPCGELTVAVLFSLVLTQAFGQVRRLAARHGCEVDAAAVGLP